MNRVFVNISNHTSLKWSEAQWRGVRDLGCDEIIDYPGAMPHVDPEASTEDIEALADEMMVELLRLSPLAVHIAGEFSLTLALLLRAQAAGMECYFATTQRVMREHVDSDGTTHRQSIFQFIRWRRASQIVGV